MNVYREACAVRSNVKLGTVVGKFPVGQRYAAGDWVSADRVFLIDRDGRRVQDCFSGGGSANLGYLAELAEQEPSQERQAAQVSRLCHALADMAAPALSHVFLRQSADEALKLALTSAHHYFVAKGRPDKTYFLELEFTRRTTMRAVGSAKTLKNSVFDVRSAYLPAMHLFYGAETQNDDEPSVDWSHLAIASLRRFVTLNGADRCAGIIVEPVQLFGELEIIPSGFLARLRSECDRLGTLLIINERLSGFGRTAGVFFSSDEGVVPDILVVGDGMSSGYLETGAALLSDHVGDTLNRANTAEMNVEGRSYTALSDVSVTNTALQLYTFGGVEAARDISAYFQARLNELLRMPYVGDVRVKGLLATIAIVEDKVRNVKFLPRATVGKRILSSALERGLIFQVIEGDVLAFAPSFNYTFADIDALVEGVRSSIAATFFSR